MQRKEVSKLVGLDYTIQYKKGKENLVTDALSKREEKRSCKAITAVTPDWVKDIVGSYANTEWLQRLLPQLAVHPNDQQRYTLSNGVVRFKGRIVMGNDEQLKTQIMQALHDSPLGWHLGVRATYHKVRHIFYWPGLKREVVQYVLECEICQHCKHE